MAESRMTLIRLGVILVFVLSLAALICATGLVVCWIFRLASAQAVSANSMDAEVLNWLNLRAGGFPAVLSALVLIAAIGTLGILRLLEPMLQAEAQRAHPTAPSSRRGKAVSVIIIVSVIIGVVWVLYLAVMNRP